MENVRSPKTDKWLLTEDPIGMHVIMKFQRRDLIGTVVDVETRKGDSFLIVQHFDGEYWPVIPFAWEVGALVRTYPEQKDVD
jgi:selenophosphate synthetase-related protein